MLSINYQTENIIVDHLPIMVCWSTNYPQKSFSIKVYKGAELVSLIAREGNNTIVTLDAISLQSFTSYTIEVLTHGDNGTEINNECLFVYDVDMLCPEGQ
ncbi:hypothetical protein U4K73_05165, partial [Klebsiella pneumoniae]|nr:hypothetical protein [Klebsiella pneumoniae]